MTDRSAEEALPDIRANTKAPRLAAVAACAVFALLAAWMAVASKGFLEADSITHYMIRRFALVDKHYLIGVWGRPLCVWIYMVPTYFGGVIGARLTSTALALVASWLTYCIVRRLAPDDAGRRFSALAVIFLCVQPLWFAHAFSELTEVTFATLLIAAFAAYQRRWFALMAALIALGPLARPEGFGFLAIAAFALVMHRKWWWLAILPFPLIAWSYAGWVVYARPTDYAWCEWLRVNWPYSENSNYGRGNLWDFVIRLPVVVSPLAFPFVWIGALELMRKWKRCLVDERARIELLLVALPMMILVGHSILRALGKMASSGEMRYMLVVSPFWAILAAKGWLHTFDRFRWKHALAWTLLVAAVPIVANKYYSVLPLQQFAAEKLATRVVDWIHANPDLKRDYPKVMASLPPVWMYLDLNQVDSRIALPLGKKTVAACPPGAMMIWDNVYSTLNSDDKLVVPLEMIEPAGWKRVTEIRYDHYGEHALAVIFVSRQPATQPSAP